MKYLKILVFLSLLVSFSCGKEFKEIKPQSNADSIKIKLELAIEKPIGNKDVFTVRLFNYGERDVGRCTLKFDNKFEHQLEGLINKDEDWEGKIKYSMLKVQECFTIPFSPDFDNYKTLGIPENETRIPKTIELNCLDGKIFWNINQ
ncbi:MAG: hypothetical protein WC358_08475 [Ignavibacteria bacterium]|jgi:hypothetical protein